MELGHNELPHIRLLTLSLHSVARIESAKHCALEHGFLNMVY